MTHRVHLDFASSAPLLPEAIQAISRVGTTDSFDARRLYDDAIQTRYDIETARETIAHFLGTDPFEVIFTSSNSESLASVIYGALRSSTQHHNVVLTPYDSEVITACVARENVVARIIPGNENATLDLETLERNLDENTRLVTIPYAHPDTGTLQNITTIVEIVRSTAPRALIHVDARIAAGYVSIDFSEMNIDLLTCEPVTFGGPAGIGILVLSHNVHLAPFIPGATQERARRAGLENVLGVMGAAAACNKTTTSREAQEALLSKKIKIDEALHAAGAQFVVESTNTLPHISAAYFPGIASSAIVAEFNRAGINIHAGSSCGSEEFEPSAQLFGVTQDDAISESVFRISVGHTTTDEDITSFMTVLESIELIRGFATR